jgi:hypothetical protein
MIVVRLAYCGQAQNWTQSLLSKEYAKQPAILRGSEITSAVECISCTSMLRAGWAPVQMSVVRDVFVLEVRQRYKPAATGSKSRRNNMPMMGSRSGAVNTAPACRLPLKSFIFLVKVVAIALGSNTGSRRLALRLAGKAVDGAPFVVSQAIVDSRTMRSGRCGLAAHGSMTRRRLLPRPQPDPAHHCRR